MRKLLITALISCCSAMSWAGLNDPPVTYQDPCIMNPNSGDCHITTMPGPGPAGPLEPIDLSPPSVIPTPTLTPVAGGGVADWNAACKAAHVADFGNYTTVTCPAGWVKSNDTCGCQLPDMMMACFSCEMNSGVCPSSAGLCKLPRGCGSLVCAKSSIQALTLNQSKVVQLANFSAGGGLNYGGISVCDIFSGATDLTIQDSLKDPVCKRLYRSLGSADKNQISIPRKNELSILDLRVDRLSVIKAFSTGDSSVLTPVIKASP